MEKYVLGIDIGGTKCAIIIGHSSQDDQIVLIRKVTFPTETCKGVEYTLNNIFAHIDAILTEENLTIKDIAGIGISCGGPLNSQKGIIMSPPNLPGWDNIPIKQLLEERYGVKTNIQNDANACALAEWKFGAGRSYQNVIFLTFGTGMGAGLILNGQLYTGTNDMAGEVGHVRMMPFGPVGYGKSGSFEGFCSGSGIAQLASQKVLEQLQTGKTVSFCSNINNTQSITAKTVAEAAFAGNKLAQEIYSTCGRYLGKALSMLIDILNPEVIILGSIYGRAKALIEPAMREEIERESLYYSRIVCNIVPASLGENIGDYASLSVACS